MPRMKAVLISILIMSWAFGIGQSQTGTSALLHQYLNIQQKRMGFNGVVLVAKDGEVLHKEVIGKASMELNAPLTINSGFKIASISKTFTAMLVMLANSEGKLKLGDSLATFFPDLKEASWRRITVDQLLSHRSGIPHNDGIADYWSTKSLLALNRQKALAEIFNMPLLFAPGVDVHYSSPGYFLLAAILENVYRQHYAVILTQKISVPLGMTHTGVYSTAAIVPGMTSFYHLLGDSLIVAPYRDPSLMKGSGDMYSTAEDLLRWTSSFSGSKWEDKIKSELFTAHTSKPLHQKDDRYGYGWFIRAPTKELSLAYYHGGGSFGCSAISVWYPREKLSIIILSNISVLPVNELWADIEKIIFNKPFELPQQHIEIKLTDEQLKKLPGTYVADAMELLIVADKSHLYAKLGNNPGFEIYPKAALTFYGKKVNITFTFQATEQGEITGLLSEGKGRTILFTRKQVMH